MRGGEGRALTDGKVTIAAPLLLPSAIKRTRHEVRFTLRKVVSKGLVIDGPAEVSDERSVVGVTGICEVSHCEVVLEK